MKEFIYVKYHKNDSPQKITRDEVLHEATCDVVAEIEDYLEHWNEYGFEITLEELFDALQKRMKE